MTNSNHNFAVRRRGIALMLVLAVVGLAALVGFAMLSSASLQSQIGDNTERVAGADCIAESAAHMAVFYLQNPSKMPASWGTTPGYAMYVRDGTVSGVEGTFDLDVTATAVAETYDIVAVGYSSGTTPLTRTIEATVQLTRATPRLAAGFGNEVVVRQNNFINGLVVANGTVSMAGTGTVNGTVRQIPLATDFVVPMNTSQINYYGADVAGGTYTMSDGTVGTPQALASATIVAAPAANANNPGKVFYYNGNVMTNGSMTFNGTLIVRGTLNVRGPGTAITTTITPVSGFPALIVDTNSLVNSANVTFRANGVVWIGGGSAWGVHTGSSVTVYGSLLMPTLNPLNAVSAGTLTVNYTPANVNVKNLSKAQQPVVSVTFLSWRQ